MERPGTGRGSNSAQLRRYWECLVLHRLRRAGEACKADLAHAADLTSTAIGAIIRKMFFNVSSRASIPMRDDDRDLDTGGTLGFAGVT
ncbi:hypothetical protein K32_13370 [Kaistia sp. 32K]|uniref:hypothetical protein n=1 Tax=Kaistia sp. 32K TaxID=2795690 RepID=UPI0019150E8D|nr:hypothetical protein [Kaistia sp. 32K]BCP52720.1 hypothetical protein K32_13370 [Kaistia sp. 32K]